MKKNQYNNLLEKYPDLINVCRENDCNYEEAVEIIEKNKTQKKLLHFI